MTTALLCFFFPSSPGVAGVATLGRGAVPRVFAQQRRTHYGFAWSAPGGPPAKRYVRPGPLTGTDPNIPLLG